MISKSIILSCKNFADFSRNVQNYLLIVQLLKVQLLFCIRNQIKYCRVLEQWLPSGESRRQDVTSWLTVITQTQPVHTPTIVGSRITYLLDAMINWPCKYIKNMPTLWINFGNFRTPYPSWGNAVNPNLVFAHIECHTFSQDIYLSTNMILINYVRLREHTSMMSDFLVNIFSNTFSLF